MRDVLPDQLDDCQLHWPTPGSELIIAEGISAANALNVVRSPEWQAVLPVQGKPQNVLTSSQIRIEASAPLMGVRDAIGAGLGDGFVLMAADQNAARSIVVFKNNEVSHISAPRSARPSSHFHIPAARNDAVAHRIRPPSIAPPHFN